MRCTTSMPLARSRPALPSRGASAKSNREESSSNTPNSRPRRASDSKPRMPRRNLRRSSSKTKTMLPLVAALGQLGRADSFTLQRSSTAPAIVARPAPSSRGVGHTKSSVPISRTRPAPPSRDQTKSCPNLRAELFGSQTSSTSLNMLPDMPSLSISDAAPVGNFLREMGSNLGADDGTNTAAKAEGMNLISHALLDFPAERIAQATVAAKAAEVAGRLFVLGQGLLPGHEMMADELAFQVGFLVVSCHALWMTVMPKIKASQASKFLTPADRKAFRSLFQPAGMTWEQYREVSIESMEWVTLEPGQEVHDAAYWLLQGDVTINGEEAPTTSQIGGLIGEHRIAETLGFVDDEAAVEDKSGVGAVAGAAGATVLKMDTEKLRKLMKNDQNLGLSISRMLFNSMNEEIKINSQPTAA